MIWTIAKRELITRGRSKGYIIGTVVLFLAMIGGALASAVIGGDDEAREVTIGIAGDGVDFESILAAGDEFVAPTLVVFDQLELGVERLESDDVDVVFDGGTLTWKGIPDFALDEFIRASVEQVRIGERVEALGLEPAQLAELFAPVDIEEVRLDGGDETLTVRAVTAGVSGLATFLLLQMWGSFMMMGVIEEKSSRVIEVLLSRIRPSTLLAGKVLGLGILAVTQMLAITIGLVIGLSLVSTVEIPGSVWGSVPVFVATFLLGFGFYATAFAALGSIVSRQEDATSAQLPAMLPLFTGYMIGAASFTAPENAAVTIGSFVPFTSPVLLPFRVALTDIPAWQIAVSLGILALSIPLMIRLAGRIYEYSLLRIGARVGLAEAWRNRGKQAL